MATMINYHVLTAVSFRMEKYNDLAINTAGKGHTRPAKLLFLILLECNIEPKKKRGENSSPNLSAALRETFQTRNHKSFNLLLRCTLIRGLKNSLTTFETNKTFLCPALFPVSAES